MICRRCKREGRPLDTRPDLPEPLASEVRQNTCQECWSEWEKMEVMVINELRLNFMDPQAIEVLHRHLREFLELTPRPD